jgi:hypothetical protein
MANLDFFLLKRLGLGLLMVRWIDAILVETFAPMKALKPDAMQWTFYSEVLGLATLSLDWTRHGRCHIHTQRDREIETGG